MTSTAIFLSAAWYMNMLVNICAVSIACNKHCWDILISMSLDDKILHLGPSLKSVKANLGYIVLDHNKYLCILDEAVKQHLGHHYIDIRFECYGYF